jgi:ribosomal protein S18 acetylase RimI-like enzyme
MMDGFSIREGTEADIAACLAIDASIATDWVLYLERAGAEPEMSFRLRWRRVAEGRRRDFALDEDFFRCWLQRGARLLVAEVDAAIRGRMLLREKWNRTLEVEDTAVDRPYRRRGLGKALLAEARRIAAGQDLQAISWEAQTDNREAIEFLIANGLRLSGLDYMLYDNDRYEQQSAREFRGVALFFTSPLK